MAIHQKSSDDAIPDDIQIEWGLTPKQIKQAQQKDKFCQEQYNKLKKHTLPSTHPYYIQDGVLMKYTTDNKQRFETIVVPEHYTLALMRLAHDELGHNGSSRTYMMLRRLYFWKGMKPQVFRYVKQCKSCQQRNSQLSGTHLDTSMCLLPQCNLYLWILLVNFIHPVQKVINMH